MLVGASALIALTYMVAGATGVLTRLANAATWLAPFEVGFTFWRYAIVASVILVALVLVHKWLPAGRRRLVEIAPGITVTVVLWVVMGVGFGRYLARFAGTYVSMYAGLASAMVALVFLYWTAIIFVYGSELNDAIRKARSKQIPS